jgi:hypothetical protein
MTHTATPSAQLNRAYVQGKVIEANLEHLRDVLIDSSAELRDGLTPLMHRFGAYVRELKDASSDADASAETQTSAH